MKRRSKPEALETMRQINCLSSGCLSQVFCHSNRKWTNVVRTVAMWCQLHRVLTFIFNLFSFCLQEKNTPKVCLWRGLQRKLTMEKKPTLKQMELLFSVWRLKRNKTWKRESQHCLLPDCRDNQIFNIPFPQLCRPCYDGLCTLSISKNKFICHEGMWSEQNEKQAEETAQR